MLYPSRKKILPRAQKCGGVRREWLRAHPGDAPKCDRGILDQAAWQRASGHLHMQQGDGTSHSHGMTKQNTTLRDGHATNADSSVHLQNPCKPLQRLQCDWLELVAGAFDCQLACETKGRKLRLSQAATNRSPFHRSLCFSRQLTHAPSGIVAGRQRALVDHLRLQVVQRRSKNVALHSVSERRVRQTGQSDAMAVCKLETLLAS